MSVTTEGKIKNLTDQPIIQYDKEAKFITLQCNCGNHYTKRVYDLLFYKKFQCRQCGIKSSSNNRRQDITKVQQFINESGCELLSKQYINPHTKLEIKCSCGNVYFQSFSDFKSIKRRSKKNTCPECSARRNAENHTFTFEEVSSFIDATGCKLLTTDYYSHLDPLKIQCRLCGEIFVNTLKDFKNNGTYACSNCTKNNISQKEKQIVDFLTKIEPLEVVLENDRTVLDGKELDIYLPSRRIAIEYNGVYYHSEKYGKDRNYHVSKTNFCQHHNIKLFQVWENEWNHSQKQLIWKSIITNALNKTETTIYARKCVIKEIDTKTKNKFLEKHHLQGSDKSKFSYGLYHKDDLVMVMTFGTPRYSKKHECEVFRLSTKINTRVVGGASKLFKFFLQNNTNIKNVITYVDRRYGNSNENVFTKIGFSFSHYTSPGYYYTKQNRVYNRLLFQKHKLAKKLETFDPTLSEKLNMEKNQYYRIWDCGHVALTYGIIL